MERIDANPSFTQKIWQTLSDLWCATEFEDPEVSRYAKQLMNDRTARGLSITAIVALTIFLASLVLHLRLGFGKEYLYTYSILIILSSNIIFSARKVRDVKTLNLLGMVLYILSGAALILLAHKTATFGPGLMATLVLLFMAMPLIPWGLREATAALSCTYFLITASSLSVQGKFDSSTLDTLQFFLVSSGAIALLLVGRNVHIRKNDVRARFDLERVKHDMELLSTRDPLTGAWNRRFLENEFDRIAEACFDQKKPLRLVLLDIDHFKIINDNNGHHFGDLVLKKVVQVFQENLSGNDYLIRLGGDEFAILSADDDLEQVVVLCLDHIRTDPQLLRQGQGVPVTMTAGIVTDRSGQVAMLSTLYKDADRALYENKRARQSGRKDERPAVSELQS